jgi:homoserine O-acetyltransferase
MKMDSEGLNKDCLLIWSGPQSMELFSALEPMPLEFGGHLGPVNVAYETWGQLNDRGDNAILICHALTGNAHALGPDGWWTGIAGTGRAIDPQRHFIICSNILGSCYGTTGPASPDSCRGHPWQMEFPIISVRDLVRLQYEWVVRLGIRQLLMVIGGSLGGMQALEWAVMYPYMVMLAVPIACSARQSAWCIGLNEVGRRAIAADPAWHGGFYDKPPAIGLALARMIAMISYRSPASFQSRFGRDVQELAVDTLFTEAIGPLFKVESYLRYQGQKLVERFDAACYYRLTQALDSHDLLRGRGTLTDVLGAISIPVQMIGIRSDMLYPVTEQKEIAALAPRAHYTEIDSADGHDAFLIECEQMNKYLADFLQEIEESEDKQ